MPEWLPDNLAELVLFRPIRIVLLIIAAFVLRRVLHRLIRRRFNVRSTDHSARAIR